MAKRDKTPPPSPQPLSVDDDVWLDQQPRESLLALVRELRELTREQDGRIASLEHELAQHKRWRFGRRSEKLKGKPSAQGTVPAGAAAGQAPPKRKARPHGRGKLPEHLPVDRAEHELPEADRICPGCQRPRTRIGEEVGSRLDFVPGYFRRRDDVRGTFACRFCQDEVKTAPLPPQAIPRCLATPSLLAYVVTSKYADHLPLNRLARIFKRQGVTLTRSTLCGWVGAVAQALAPLYELLRRDVLLSRVLGADDTTLPYLDPPRDRTRTGHLWCYFGDAHHPHVFFEFSPNWQNRWPLATLEGWQGHLQADAYKGWDAVFKRDPKVLEVGCNAHSRRKYFEARQTSSALATVALGYFRELYDVEREAKGMSPEGRRFLRQLKAEPVMRRFRVWLDEVRPKVLPKSPIGKALTYANNQWDALSRYLVDGELSIDNNATERELRMVAVGRANWMFAGDENGGHRAAIIYSFVASCQRNGIDPLAYFTDVLSRLGEHPRDDLAALLPRNWKPKAVTPANKIVTATAQAAS